MESNQKEAQILSEIRSSETDAEKLMLEANKEKGRIIDITKKDASILFLSKKEEIQKQHEKVIAEFKVKSVSVRAKKIEDGIKSAKNIKAKAEKNISKAVDFVMKKIEEMI
jgi:V/A-type H+/Na+-transporting ATPase subunit G/H